MKDEAKIREEVVVEMQGTVTQLVGVFLWDW